MRLAAAGDGHVELVVSDDGRGFATSDLADLVRRGHFGLAGMRERVSIIGGRWDVESSPDGGTRIIVLLPTQPVSVAAGATSAAELAAAR